MECSSHDGRDLIRSPETRGTVILVHFDNGSLPPWAKKGGVVLLLAPRGTEDKKTVIANTCNATLSQRLIYMLYLCLSMLICPY